jgi:hypothetical protein
VSTGSGSAPEVDVPHSPRALATKITGAWGNGDATWSIWHFSFLLCASHLSRPWGAVRTGVGGSAGVGNGARSKNVLSSIRRHTHFSAHAHVSGSMHGAGPREEGWRGAPPSLARVHSSRKDGVCSPNDDERNTNCARVQAKTGVTSCPFLLSRNTVSGSDSDLGFDLDDQTVCGKAPRLWHDSSEVANLKVNPCDGHSALQANTKEPRCQ